MTRLTSNLVVESRARPRVAGMLVMFCLGVLVPSLSVAAPAQAGSQGPMTSPFASDAASIDCEAAKQRVKRARARLVQANRTLRRAKRALREADTAATRQRALKRVNLARKRARRAKKALAAAKRARQRACAPTSAPPANKPPAFPDPLGFTWDQVILSDPSTLEPVEVSHTIIVHTPATDPDGDPLTYTWTSTLGEIRTLDPDGLIADWKTPILSGSAVPADATIKADDGRGGSDNYTFTFRPD